MSPFKKVHGVYNLACLVTMFGAFAGAMAICLSVSGHVGFALIALMIAGLADLFDGFVARRLKLSPFEKEFGVQLDTVVDVSSFVAAPAVIGVAIAGGNLWVIVCIVLYMLAGLVRLAHFNTDAVAGLAATDAHHGLPVTYAALVLPIVLIPVGLLVSGVFAAALGGVYLLLAVLFVAPVVVPKPRGVFYLIFPLLAVGLIAFWATDILDLARR